jgi:hypothetical protein
MVPAAAGATVPQCACRVRSALADHAMTCRSSGTMTLRMLVTACIARDTGVAMAAEPHLRHLRRGGEQDGAVDICGDIMRVLPDILVIMDIGAPGGSNAHSWATAADGAAAAASKPGRRGEGIRPGALVRRVRARG